MKNLLNEIRKIITRNLYYCEVGARTSTEDGRIYVQDPWESFRKIIDLFCFEPDIDEYNSLQKRKTQNENIFPYALINDTKEVTLNLTKIRGCSSLYKPNFKFLKNNISKLNTRLFWPSKNIELFYETNSNKFNFLNFNQNKNNLMYVYENDKFKNILLKEISTTKVMSNFIANYSPHVKGAITIHISRLRYIYDRYIVGFLDDRSRSVDFICLIILLELHFSINISHIIFILLLVKYIIIFAGSFYLVSKGGWIEHQMNKKLGELYSQFVSDSTIKK